MLRPGIDRKYAFVLLGVSVLILAVGIALKPNKPEPKAPPSEGEIARIQRLTQQRRLRDLSSYLADSADAVGGRLVTVEHGRTGVLWDAKGHILTAKETFPSGRRESVLLPDGRRIDAERSAVAPGSPFAVWKGAAGVRVPPSPRNTRAEPGGWVLAVAKNEDGQVVFAHGLYQGSVNARCGSFDYRAVQSSAPLSIALVGGGVFTLEGELLGFIAQCDGRPIAISVGTVADALQKPISLDEELEQQYGFRVAMRGEPSVMQITGVWNSSVAQTAGLRAGDIVLALEDTPVQSPADMAPLARASDTVHTVKVRRGRRVLRIPLPAMVEPTDGAPVSAPQGITLAPATSDAGVVVAAVVPNSPAAAAGVIQGDVIRRVGDSNVQDRAGAMHALERLGGRPVVLEVERNGKRLEVLVSP